MKKRLDNFFFIRLAGYQTEATVKTKAKRLRYFVADL